MINNYNINNHKISIELLNENKIKIYIVNPINNIYESITHISDLNSPFGYQDTYSIILECFKKSSPNYLFTTAFKDDIYYLKFQSTFLIYQFTFLIKVERKESDLTIHKIIKLNELLKEIQNKNETEINDLKEIKIKNETEINDLKEIINNINFVDIKFSKVSLSKSITYLYVPILSVDVVLYSINDSYKIKSLYKLEKLTLSSDFKTLDFENNNLKTLILIAPKLETLNGINKFPNLEILELITCDMLYDIKSHLTDTNIKKIIFRKCGGNQKRNMISYCNAKNIELSFF
jgi:hypothetical protein